MDTVVPSVSPSMAEYNPVPFDHTYVLYDPRDAVSVALVHLLLLPIYTMVFYTSWFFLTREIEPVIVVGGHLVGEVVNKVVKHAVRQPRPDFHRDFGLGLYGLTYGMPSAHAQFMGFFAAYFVCVFAFKLQRFGRWQRVVGSAALVVLLVLVAFLRVYLLYHTPQQVLVGAAVGALLGLAYFGIIAVARDVGFIDWILGWGAVRYFYIKDSYFHCYQTFAQEYEAHMARRGCV